MGPKETKVMFYYLDVTYLCFLTNEEKTWTPEVVLGSNFNLTADPHFSRKPVCISTVFRFSISESFK